MALNAQLANTPSGEDYAFKNYTGSDIPANVAVSVDTTAANVISPTNLVDAIGVIPVAASGNPVVGVTMEIIPAGRVGRVRCGGVAPMFADGAITAGTFVDASAAATKVGYAKVHVAAASTLGMALSTATADGDPVLVLIAQGRNA